MDRPSLCPEEKEEVLENQFMNSDSNVKESSSKIDIETEGPTHHSGLYVQTGKSTLASLGGHYDNCTYNKSTLDSQVICRINTDNGSIEKRPLPHANPQPTRKKFYNSFERPIFRATGEEDDLSEDSGFEEYHFLDLPNVSGPPVLHECSIENELSKEDPSTTALQRLQQQSLVPKRGPYNHRMNEEARVDQIPMCTLPSLHLKFDFERNGDRVLDWNICFQANSVILDHSFTSLDSIDPKLSHHGHFFKKKSQKRSESANEWRVSHGSHRNHSKFSEEKFHYLRTTIFGEHRHSNSKVSASLRQVPHHEDSYSVNLFKC
jgi:hypothetical protein